MAAEQFEVSEPFIGEVYGEATLACVAAGCSNSLSEGKAGPEDEQVGGEPESQSCLSANEAHIAKRKIAADHLF